MTVVLSTSTSATTNPANNISNKSTSTPKPTSQFSISKIIEKLKNRRSLQPQSQSQAQIQNQDAVQHHIDSRPPLIPSPLPLVLPQHQRTLSQLGWTTLTFPSPRPPLDTTASLSSPPPPGPHPLQTASTALFTAAQEFFSLPSSQKQAWTHRLGTEEGWTLIPGEKEYITLRTLSYCPPCLRDAAARYWDLMGAHLLRTLGRMEENLGAPSSSLQNFVGPCAHMPTTEESKTSTMIRIFRYEVDAPDGRKIVAEPHADLGLLSCVVGDVPGLEVWDGGNWFDVEREYVREGEGGIGGRATILVGRQLERFTNARFPAGGHRVVSYSSPGQDGTGASSSSSSSPAAPTHRHSLVFVLRAHSPVIISSSALETDITGKWEYPIEGRTAGDLYDEIKGKHFNINIGKEEREKQRRKVLEGKKGETMAGTG